MQLFVQKIMNNLYKPSYGVMLPEILHLELRINSLIGTKNPSWVINNMI